MIAFNYSQLLNCKFLISEKVLAAITLCFISFILYSYRRNWRFNVEEKVWMYKIPGVANYKKIGSIEQGIFYYFDPKIWRRVLREFQFDSDKIEKWPSF